MAADSLGQDHSVRQKLGNRIEGALEQRADLEGELARGEATRPARHRLVRTVGWPASTAVSLYLVAPTLLETLGSLAIRPTR